MKITRISIKNFRLLEDVELCMEDGATVIVGRNNSGKTSLTELFRRLLDEKSPRFKLEDFSLGVYEQFWDAYELYRKEEEETNIRKVLPLISTTLNVEYGKDEDFGPLADFVIDIDEECTSAQINIRYELAPGKIAQLFADLGEDKVAFFKALKERMDPSSSPKFFEATIEAQDPNDPTNRKVLAIANLRSVLQFAFINAQRAIDDASNKEKAVLGKIFEKLFTAASSEAANTDDQATAAALTSAADKVQEQINEGFNEQLTNLAPTFDLFGYPGLTDPKLRTETILKVEQLFSNHTTVGYLGVNGVNLPESYNGLGPRNLIFILLKLFEFFKEFANRQPASGIHLIFIEEPEAHLHPQMQSVFIRQLENIRELFATHYNNGNLWPVQFVVTTHSSHIANEATFDSMRYFLTQPRQTGSILHKTEIKDLRTGLGDEENSKSGEEEPMTDREFLHKYMTLTRCDLLFADKAILIEGATERLLLPEMIRKYDDEVTNTDPKLGSQYLTIMEVGGAYAHRFFKLLDFLNLRTLVITDLDTIDENDQRKKCKVSLGTHSSNACINSWYATSEKENPTKNEIMGKSEGDKVAGNRRLAFQIPHVDGDACGRSFEDAFMLANPDKFGITGESANEREIQAWEAAEKVKKTDFALEYAIEKVDWTTPLYIVEGLRWLADDTPSTASSGEEAAEGNADG
ncbi:MAG TPA: ATP-dependent endonuclease [Sedimentisphaerales bacterium]|nr:ATP-dependent endonuclease [Sedimentisphaerales bacterium]